MTNSLEAKSKYDEHKYTGFEWLGNIPDHWAMKRFLNQFSFSKGLNITKENLQEKGVPCVNYGEVHSKYGFAVNPDKHPLKCVSEDYLSLSPKSLLRDGDFVFADTSEDIEGSGNFTQLVGKHCVFAGYHTVIVRPVPGNNNLFLAYLFESMSYRNQIRRSVKGVKVYSITKAILKNTRIWLPGLKEQTAIANFLDRKTAQIDQAIAIKEKQIALLKERKQILIQNAVTRGLDPTVPMKDSGVEWIGEIPEHWDILKIRSLSRVVRGSSPRPAGDPKYFSDQGYHWVTVGEVTKDEKLFLVETKTYLTKAGMENSRYIPKGTFILTNSGATLGVPKITNINCCINDGVLAFLEFKLKKISKKYLYYCFLWQVQRLRDEMNQGATQPNLNTALVKNLPIGVCSLGEQLSIVEYIEIETAKVDSVVCMLQLQIDQLKEYKATLINSAVTGKIKVVGDETTGQSNQQSNGA